MKPVLKCLGTALVALLLLALLAAAGIYVLSERAIHRRYTGVPLSGIAVPQDAAAIERGKRLATIYGCFNSCHGKQMEGFVLFDEPGIARINAPNLTRVVHEYTDAELERLIRHGVKRDGTTTWAMPSAMFAHLSDEDLGDVIAFVRAAPLLDGPMRDVTLRALGRLGIVLGKFKPHAGVIAHDVPHAKTTDRSDRMAFGKYLVMTTCTECHGQDLQGDDYLRAPGLTVMAGYSDAAFRRLMKTGIALGGRKLGLMTEMGETRFPSLTEEELDAMSAYLARTYGQATAASEPGSVAPVGPPVTDVNSTRAGNELSLSAAAESAAARD